MNSFEQILREAGVTPAQRRNVIDSVSGAISTQYVENVRAANSLSSVGAHAAALETAANRMEADGVGGHPAHGHAAVLREMAASMRADAASGKLPFVFDGVNASAAPQARRDERVLKQALAYAKRLGINLNGGRVERHELDRVLAGCQVSDRMLIKALLANAGMID